VTWVQPLALVALFRFLLKLSGSETLAENHYPAHQDVIGDLNAADADYISVILGPGRECSRTLYSTIAS